VTIRASRWPALCLVAAALWLVLAWAAPDAGAVRRGSGTNAPKGGAGTTASKGQQAKGPANGGEQPFPPGPLDALTSGKELGASGQVDPITGLGLRNPVCDHPGQIQNRQTRVSCQANGTPESQYPAANYGFDIFIDAGIDAPTGTFAKGFVMILNGLWLGLIFVLKLVLELLGLAFGLNPFAEGQSMRQVVAALDRIYRTITDPWLSAAIVAGGIWFAYKGLLRREFAASIGGTLAGIAMLIVGLWVVHQPAASVGRLAGLADQVAVTAISAPQSGRLSNPMGTYAESMSRTWSRLVEVPFAGLDFSDVRWALSRPPAEAVKRADEKFCDDVGALTLLAQVASLGNEEATAVCQTLARRRYGQPRRVIDLYLRSSPGSPARQELWNYFSKDEADAYGAKVAAQGGDGVLTRLSMLALFALGLLGAVLLLAWLAIRLFTQAAIAFVLLLAAPFAVFFPMLGESGRQAFKTWGLTLIGATVAKVVYAAFLSVVLLGMAIFGSLGDATGFLLACAFAWAVFLKRVTLVAWMSVGDTEGGRAISPVAQIAAYAMGRRLTKGVSGTIRGTGQRTAQALRPGDGDPRTRESAKRTLSESARGLADHRYREATQTVADFEGASRARGSAAGNATGRREAAAASAYASRQGAGATGKAADGAGVPGQTAEPVTDRERQRYERAQELVQRVNGNERKLGRRWNDRDLQRFAAEDRELLARSRDPADHAHRAGYERTQFESLRGEDRERAEEAIAKATRRDREQLVAASERPERVVGGRYEAVDRARRTKQGSVNGPPREDAGKGQAASGNGPAREGAGRGQAGDGPGSDQTGDGPGHDRTAMPERVRRQRREVAHRAHRRNLSRGT
jgi:hypothetical protein